LILSVSESILERLPSGSEVKCVIAGFPGVLDSGVQAQDTRTRVQSAEAVVDSTQPLADRPDRHFLALEFPDLVP
jgi:hypothetical protein